MKRNLFRRLYITAAVSLSAIIFSLTAENFTGTASATVSYYDLDDPVKTADTSLESGQNVTYSTVYFGEYPQTMVKKNDPVYKNLIKSEAWDDDVVKIRGKKYKRVSFSNVIKSKGNRAGKNILTSQDLSDYETGKYVYDDESSYVYFRYDPLKWRILNNDGSKVILITDRIIDGSMYSKKKKVSGFSDSDVSYFLNSDFIKEAVPADQQDDILTESAGKVFTLSETDMNETGANAYNFGFARGTSVKDEARRASATDYAWACGVRKSAMSSSSVKGFSGYWIESASENSIKTVRPDGSVSSLDIKKSHKDIYGVRPCIYMSLSSAEQLFTAGGKLESADSRSKGFSDTDRESEVGSAEITDISYTSEAAEDDRDKYTVTLSYTVKPEKKADGFYIKVPDGKGGSRKLFALSDQIKKSDEDENVCTVVYSYQVKVPYNDTVNLKIRPVKIKNGSLKYGKWSEKYETEIKADRPQEKKSGNSDKKESSASAGGDSPQKRTNGNGTGRIMVFVLIAAVAAVFYSDWYLRNHRER